MTQTFKVRSTSQIRRQPMRHKISPTREREQIALAMNRYKAFCNILSLTNDESAALLDVSLSTWSRIKSGKFPTYASQDMMMRTCFFYDIMDILITKLNKSLNILFKEGTVAKYPTLSPITAMIYGGTPSINDVYCHFRDIRDRTRI